jgi:hypothetical protein
MARAMGAVLFILLLASCGRGVNRVSEEEAKEAVMVAQTAIMMSWIALGFGDSVEGAHMDQATGALMLEQYDLSEFATEYSCVSGAIQRNGEAELSFEGGPVSTLTMSVDLANIQSIVSFAGQVTANGREFDIVVDAEDFR